MTTNKLDRLDKSGERILTPIQIWNEFRKIKQAGGTLLDLYTLIDNKGNAITPPGAQSAEDEAVGNLCVMGLSGDADPANNFKGSLIFGITAVRGTKFDGERNPKSGVLETKFYNDADPLASRSEFLEMIERLAGPHAKFKVVDRAGFDTPSDEGEEEETPNTTRPQPNLLEAKTRIQAKAEALEKILDSAEGPFPETVRKQILDALELEKRIPEPDTASNPTIGGVEITLARGMRKPRDKDIEITDHMDLSDIATDTLSITVHADRLEDWTEGIPEDTPLNIAAGRVIRATLGELGWADASNAESPLRKAARDAGIKQITLSIEFDKSKFGEGAEGRTAIELDHITLED